MLKAGTYEFADSMCYMCLNELGNDIMCPNGVDEYGYSLDLESALCIDRDVTIEAEVAGSVVLDAKGARRVIYVSTAGRAKLIGLNITGGAAGSVSSRASIEPTRDFQIAPLVY